MMFKTGKHEGKSTQEVLLKKPDFAQWYIGQHPNSPPARAFVQHMRDFDSKPFTQKCDGGCGSLASRASTYRGSATLYFWCSRCNPYESGAEESKLTIVSTIGEVLQHIDWTASSNRNLKRRIVRSLARAKGLPARVGEKQAIEFLA
jgi:hypothetical protein